MMCDREKVIGHLYDCLVASRPENMWVFVRKDIVGDALALLKEQDSLLGIWQTADGITFISRGTAKQGEERGVLFGKAFMHDWLEKEFLYRELLTDDIRKVFDEAKNL